MENNTLDELAHSLYQKEQERLNQEDVYYQTQRQLDKKIDNLSERRYQLTLLVKRETEKMPHILKKYGASYDEAGGFFAVTEQLLAESDRSYRCAVSKIESEKEENQRHFNRNQDFLEE